MKTPKATWLPSFILAFLLGTSMTAQPPKPAEGFRWMLNEQYSDEFNGEKLDLEKWYDHHPGWVGRAPGIFLPSQLTVKDGLLQLKNRKLDHDTVVTHWDGSQSTFSIAGGAVVSRHQGAQFGYYECSQKASKIRMSSTFWMTSGGWAGPDPCTSDKYSQELDIQEAVGGATSSGNQSFRNSMHSNSHFNYTNCEGVKTNYSSGARISLEEGEVSDTFHTYAAHWKNANHADLYLDGKYGDAITFRTDLKSNPFEKPMQINMVTETYDWVTPPSDEDLADDSRNTTYIDWVRSWKLVPVDYQEEAEVGLLKNGDFETGDFTYWTGWGGDPLEVVNEQVHSGQYAVHIGGPGAPEYVVNLRAHTEYTLSCYGKVVEGSGPILFGIKDPSEKVLGSVEVIETSYTKKSIQFTTESSGVSLKFYFYAPNASAEGYADDFVLITLDPSDTVEIEEVPVFDESVFFDEDPNVLPASDHLSVRLGFQTNGDRLIRLKLLNKAHELMGENLYPALAGYGIKTLTLQLDSLPPAGKGYQLIAELLHTDSTTVSPSEPDTISLELQEPVDIAIKVMDIRDDQPIEGAEVIVNESSSQTGANGTIEFLDVPPGMVSIQITKAGFDDLSLPDMEISRDTLMELRLSPVTHAVTVLVTDAYTGDRVKSAMVNLGEISEISDYQGKVVFGTYAGETILTASAARYSSSSIQVSISSDTVLQIQLKRVRADARFVVKLDGSPLHNALVSVGAFSEFTSAIGQTFIPDLKTDTLYSYQVDYLEETLFMDSMVLKTDSTIRINISTQNVAGPYTSSRIEIYPNPATRELHVVGLNREATYQISNVTGTVVKRGIYTVGSSLDISILKDGIYFVSFEKGRPLKMIKH